MAEICCDVVSGTETSDDTCSEPSSRAARKRKMEVRRFRFASGVALPPANLYRKRQRLDCFGAAGAPVPAVLPLDFAAGVVESRAEGSASVGNDSRSNSSSDPSPSPAGEVVVSGQWPRYGVTSVCGRRRDMEDAVSVNPAFLRRGSQIPASYHFFGVYDGHGCSHVARSCRDRMHKVMAEELESHGGVDPPLPVAEWKALMERSFSRMDTEVLAWCSRGAARNDANCRCELQTPKCEHVGSTAVVAVVASDRIVVANCGDSRAVLCRKGVPVPLSLDHKPDRPDELQRIQEAGGRVIYWDGARVLGVLAMSRAIGDNYLKPYVISEPEVTVTERTEEDECLILASDGLWDVVSNGTACEIVRMCLRGNAAGSSRPPPPPPGPEGDAVGVGRVEREGGGGCGSDKACSDAALLLTKLALARQSSDNVSVVVVDLRRNS